MDIDEIRQALGTAWEEIEKTTGIPNPSIFVRTVKGPVELFAGHFYYIVSDKPHQYTRLVYIEVGRFYSYIGMNFGYAGIAYTSQLVSDRLVLVTEVPREYWDRAQKARDMYLSAIRAIDKSIEGTINKQGNG